MMLKSDVDVKSSLTWLCSVPKEGAAKVIDAVFEIIKADTEPDFYAILARELNTTEGNLETCLETLVGLTVEAVRAKATAEDLEKKLSLINLSELVIQIFLDNLSKDREAIREALGSLDDECSAIPTYSNVEWRLEVLLASRSFKNQLKPGVLLGIQLANSDGAKTSQNIKCDPAAIFHLRDVLEEALVEAKSLHMQKLSRQLK